MKLKILFCGILLCNSLYSKVLIMTHSYNRPDFIEIQDKTFKKFFKNDYEFVVFNDAPGDEMRWKIDEIARKLGLCCIKIPQEIHIQHYLPRDGGFINTPCTRCADVMQYSLNELGFNHDDFVMIIDSDMFLVKDFDLKKYMQGYQLAAVPQTRGKIDYLWNGLMFFDMQNLPDKNSFSMNCGRVEREGVDVGGYTYFYIKNHPEVSVRYIDHMFLSQNSSALIDTYPFPSSLQARYQIISKGSYERIISYRCEACKKRNCMCYHDGRITQELGLDSAIVAFQVSNGSMDRGIELLLNNTFLHYRSGGNWEGRSQEYHNQKTFLLNRFVQTILSRDQIVT